MQGDIVKHENDLDGLEHLPEIVDDIGKLKEIFPAGKPRQAFRDHCKSLPKQIAAMRARIRWASREYQLAQIKYRGFMSVQSQQDGTMMSQMSALLRGPQDAPALDEVEMIRTIIGQRTVDDDLNQVRRRIDALDAMIKDGYRVLYKALDSYNDLVAIQQRNAKRNVKFRNNMRTFIESMIVDEVANS